MTPRFCSRLRAWNCGAATLAAARQILHKVLALEPRRRDEIIALGWARYESNQDAGFVCIDAAVDAAIAASEFQAAAGLLQAFIDRVPAHIPALLKLVEVCVDGGLETAMYETQARLTDAYLATSQPAEARVIAEDLVAREPWEPAHIERFRQALVMLRVPEPDTVIAQRLNGRDSIHRDGSFRGPARARCRRVDGSGRGTGGGDDRAARRSRRRRVRLLPPSRRPGRPQPSPPTSI